MGNVPPWHLSAILHSKLSSLPSKTKKQYTIPHIFPNNCSQQSFISTEQEICSIYSMATQRTYRMSYKFFTAAPTSFKMVYLEFIIPPLSLLHYLQIYLLGSVTARLHLLYITIISATEKCILQVSCKHKSE